MSKTIIFIQVQDRPGITEAELPDNPTAEDIVGALKKGGIDIDQDSNVFIDDADEPLGHGGKQHAEGLKSGSRIHVTRCKKIKVAVHFHEKTIERAFSPGTRVRKVKEWAVRELKINPTDAGEHILQVCNSTRQPPADTPLSELTDGKTCAVCFDLVPEKRVEG